MATQSELQNRITFEPGKCGGRPCIRGIRMRVVDILELLGAGADFDEILPITRSSNGMTSTPHWSMPPD